MEQEKLKVGLFIDTYFPTIDGVIVVVDNYAKQLNKKEDISAFVAAPGKESSNEGLDYKVIRCKEITKEKWNTLTPAFLKLIDGYVQGINNYAKAHPEEVLHKKIFPITLQEYVSSTVLALTVFNGADKALMDIFNNNIHYSPYYKKYFR